MRPQFFSSHILHACHSEAICSWGDTVIETRCTDGGTFTVSLAHRLLLPQVARVTAIVPRAVMLNGLSGRWQLFLVWFPCIPRCMCCLKDGRGDTMLS